MTTKHTPGPWKWRVDGRDANARLIAAAPDMLEALRFIAKFSENQKADVIDISLKAINFEARKMIKKIEGGAE